MEELPIKPSGILMHQEFITPEHEAKLIHIFENELEWPTRPGRLSLHYGYSFSYKTFGIDEETPFKSFPDWLEPLLPTTEGRPPDQVCLQQYAPGTGIPPHVDTHGPFDQLYSLSLGSPLFMQFANKETGEKIEIDLLPRSHHVRIRSLVVPSLGRDALLAVLGIVRNLADLGVGQVAGFAGAHAGLGLGDAEAAGELARGAGALGVLHLEAAAVAGDADDNLGGVDAGLCDHGEGVESLGLVDVGAETVTVGAARADHGVSVICGSHVYNVINKRSHILHGKGLEVPVSSRESNRDSLATLSNLGPHHLEELNIVGSIGRRASRASRAGVLPVKVNTVELVVVKHSHDVLGKPIAVGRLDGVTVKLEAGRIGRAGPATEGDDLLPAALDFLEFEELLPDVGLQKNGEVRGQASEGEVDVRVRRLDLGQLGDVHVETRTAEVVALEVAYVEELGGLLAVADDLVATVSNAAGLRLACTRGTALGSGVCAELGSDAAEAIARAAGVKGAGVHAGEIPACLGIGRLLGARLLRAADSIGDGHRHGVLSLAETDRLTELKLGAAAEAPGVLVNILDELLRDAKVLAERVAAIAGLDLVDVAGSVLGRLRGLVGEGTGAAADPLLHGEGGAEVLLGVVLVEVGGGDLAPLCERGTAVAGVDLDSPTVGAGSKHAVNTSEAGLKLDIPGLDSVGGENTKVDRLLGSLRNVDTLAVGPGPGSSLDSLEVSNGISSEETQSLGMLAARGARLLHLGADVQTGDGRARLGEKNGSATDSTAIEVVGEETSGGSNTVTRSKSASTTEGGRSLDGGLFSTTVAHKRNRALSSTRLYTASLLATGLGRSNRNTGV
ncbi:hypothetical protein HG530_007131 [Fusarium avenaceum]|nr:hypothetical protein HG530_007131 [Fusarium avenaceum]